MKFNFLYKRPLLNIVIISLITIGFALFLPKANIDNDVSKMIPEDNPSSVAYVENSKIFGTGSVIIIGLKSKKGSILTPENMEIVNNITKEAEHIFSPVIKEAVESSTQENADSELLGDFDTPATTTQGSDEIDVLGDFDTNDTATPVDANKSMGTNTAPQALQNVQFTQDRNGVIISWDAINDSSAKKIVVSRWKISRKEIETLKKNEKQIHIGNLNFDETYNFELHTVNAAGVKSKAYRKKFYIALPSKYPLVKKIMSITNTDFLEGTAEGIVISPLIDIEKNGVPRTQAEFDIVRNKLASWDMYDLNLLSKNEESTAIYVMLADNTKVKHHEMVYNQIEKIIKTYNHDNLEINISGLPAITLLIGTLMISDLAVLIPFVVLAIMMILLVSFKKISGVILPLTGVLISTIWAVGLMVISGKRIDLIGTSIPVILIAVGSAYGIHIITHYYEEMKKAGNVSNEEHKKILMDIVNTVAPPVFFASLTTIAGFLSFMTSPMETLRNFGLYTSIGIFAAIVVAIIFIPSVLLIKHSNFKKKEIVVVSDKPDFITKLMLGVYHGLLKRRYIIIIVTVLVVGFSMYYITKIKIDSQLIKYFKNDSSVTASDRFLNESFAGTHMLDVTIKGVNPGDLAEPQILSSMDKLSEMLQENYLQIKKIMGYHDFIKKLNEVMHYDSKNPKDFYEIPLDPVKYNLENQSDLKGLITQYLLLYSGDLKEYAGVDTLSPNIAKMTLVMTTSDPYFIRSVIKDIKSFSKINFPANYTISVSGGSDITNALNDIVVNSQIYSLLLSFILVFSIIAFSHKSIYAGLIGIIPLSVSVIFNFGLMGLLDIPLNMGTALIASIAVGIGVDYTIHFLSSYKEQRMKSDNLEIVTTKALLTSGKAIVFNASAVGLGFAVMLFSSFVPLIHLGILASLVMVTSSLGALMLLPVILNIFDPKFLRK
ncbi:MAG: hypothetical protein A2015_05440 [Spirochaetes bacterium GWF1_31_7]|nr:MAG: hypothetical protein A2Y30_04770 [Spirochaetes bacterium GWE1_32_154]OHD47807.1 MAG: hypothetical protein A2Y29_09500 [Spirochaetes bacterium GWE2_31_10]OHD52535.1 MAG: hypothetical protein A2015_05440 [Spirochaetes bacterium GWF1_31_7]OHD80738.1 MAG: hypothetical protein A2355_17455 [Spirochaetes bacterium RIFOXYB1_FULL_32_8]HBI36282.1 hypothetical protein [Spirochaetia bacterium]